MKKKDTRTYADRKAKDPKYGEKTVIRVSAARRKTVSIIKQEAGGKCCICEYSKCIAALEFHHINPNIKESKIIGSTLSLAKQREEAKKCILVCANCHREIHAGLVEIINSNNCWERGHDLNMRPGIYETPELPGCSTPRCIQ